jgi:nucleotide-binding universal stress UspA family protein
MFNRILVPLDGSELAEQVLPYISMLAKPGQVSITLLHVLEPLSYRVVAASRDIPVEQVKVEMQAYSQEYLEKVATSFREQGMRVLTKVLVGAAASCIVDEGSRELGDLIAMSTHGRSGVARWAFGSVTDKVIHTTINPLLIVRSSDKPPSEEEIAIKSIIVPLDGSELAEQILPHVADLAKTLDLGVNLLRVTPSAGDYYRFMDYPLPRYDDLAEQMDAEAMEYLKSQGQRLRSQGIFHVEERLSHGSPAIAVTDFARETPNSLVAMTTHGRSGVGRWILGSVADRVIRHSGGPVLVIRPTE